MHMASQGTGNYGPMGVLDWSHGTTLAGQDIMDDLCEEMDKHDVQEKANGMASRLKTKTKKAKSRS